MREEMDAIVKKDIQSHKNEKTLRKQRLVTASRHDAGVISVSSQNAKNYAPEVRARDFRHTRHDAHVRFVSYDNGQDLLFVHRVTQYSEYVTATIATLQP